MLVPGMPRWDEAMQRMQQEWEAEYKAVYGSDTPFPSEVAWLTGRGTFREYSYAAVAFCPFTYHPRSGRLEYHSEVRIEIDCHFPSPSGSEDRLVSETLSNPISREKASTLFSNLEQVADLYPAREPSAPLSDEIYDYVIITVGSLQGAIAASGFPGWKATQGHNLRTVLTTDIEISSQPGIDLAEQIRNFLRSSYATWGIEYVLLVGDYATVPMRICYPDPDYHVYAPWDPGLIAPGTPTDYYYADLSFPDELSWDSDGDGFHGEYGHDDPDFLAEVAVGRIPVNAPYRITHTLNKLVAFEQDTGAWKTNVLHGGAILFFENQNHGDYPFIDGATCLDSIETGLMDGYSITHFSEQEGIVHSPFDWPALTESSFTSTWGNGQYAVVNWSGHGWCDGAYRTVWEWDDGDGVPESGNGEMQSHRFIGLGSSHLHDDHPSIIFAISCNVGYPEPNPYGNLGIDLLTLPGWGASVGIVSSARPAAISRNWKNDPGGTEQICYDFNRYLIAESAPVGDALYDGKFDATMNYGWDCLYEYVNLYNFNLFGDPSLEILSAPAEVPGAPGEDREARYLLPNAPNPFESVSTLHFVVPSSGLLRVTVYDVGGRHIATLADGTRNAGEYALSWNATDDAGSAVAPGIYFIRLETGGRSETRRIALIR
jgi:hypothetical protein